MTYSLRNASLEQDADPVEYHAPGRLPATAHLAPRSFVLLRVAGDGDARVMRDANGVAAGAAAAVERAASSSGSALPGEARARFESSLDADLSLVRVHTGADSAAAANAVGARAYTVGNDIHFAAGQYAPSDPFGLHLLAHEVAHTQQQDGASPHRQDKLEVSSPGDAAELDADRAADAMITGAPTAVSRAAGVARMIQRDPDPGAMPAAGAAPAAAGASRGQPGQQPARCPGDPLSPAEQTFVNNCSHAAQIAQVASDHFGLFLDSVAIAYSTAWQNHIRNIQSAGQKEKDANSLVLGLILAASGGAIGGVVGDAMRKLGAGTPIVDGMKDLAKQGFKSAAPSASAPSGFAAMPPNPTAWLASAHLRISSEVLTPADEIVESWQKAIQDADPNFDYSFDPAAAVTTMLTVYGKSLITIQPVPDPDGVELGFERGFLLDWVETQAASCLSVLPTGIPATSAIIAYGKRIGIADIDQRLNAKLGPSVHPRQPGGGI